MKLTTEVNMDGLRRRMVALANPATFDSLVDRVHFEVHRKVVEDTPKRWTGQTRRGWIVRRSEPGTRIIENRTKAMAYLEWGTPRSGAWIYPRVKKALFVPLTRKAAFFARGQATWGGAEGGSESDPEPGAAVSYVTKRGNLRTQRLTYGTDYVLARRVRGIEPRRIAQKAQAFGQARLVQELEGVLRKVIRG